jgi:adenosylcobinamide kinase/adenosylcobinamide-phosphate guanylyltransferase
MTQTLIIGGARSGKSDLALQLAKASGRDVLFVATMEPRDDELRARVRAHRGARPDSWRTLEEPLAVVDALTREARTGEFVLLDCVTLWISNLLLDAAGERDVDAMAAGDAAGIVAATGAEAERLVRWLTSFAGHVAIVTNESGAGVVPAYRLGRMFRDALGAANRRLAASCDTVLYTVAGLALDLRALGARPIDDAAETPPA